ncbi:MAG: hypothetical protein ACO3JL_03985 [Myxococcota bacterium]
MIPPRLQRPQTPVLQQVFAQIGKSVDPKSAAGVQISAEEAQQISSLLTKLPEAKQAEVRGELLQLFQLDMFQATPEAREVFAQTLQVAPEALKPRAQAELVGLSSQRTAMQMAFELKAKKGKVTQPEMRAIIQKAKQLDPSSQQFLAAVIRNGSRDQTIPVASDARPLLRDWIGSLEQQGAMSAWANRLDAPPARNFDYLSMLLLRGGCFEDLLAAFMIHIAGQMEREQFAKMQELQRSEAAAAQQQNAPTASTSRQTAFVREALGDAAPAPRAATPQSAPPKPAAHQAAQTTQAPREADVQALKRDTEALVQSANALWNNDGVLTAGETQRLVDRLNAIDPAYRGPIANSLARAFSAGLGDQISQGGKDSTDLKPLVAWATANQNVAIPSDPLREPSDLTLQKLMASDKLEDKIAACLLGPVGEDKEKGALVRAVLDACQSDPAAASAHAPVADARSDSQAEAPKGAAKAAPAQAAAATQKPDLEAAKGRLAGALSELQSLQGQLGSDPQQNLAIAHHCHQLALSTVADLKHMNAPELAGGLQALEAVAEQFGAAIPQLEATLGGATAPGGPGTEKSRQLLFEEMKNMMQEFQAVLQAISNILNSMNQGAMNSIRAIRGG